MTNFKELTFDEYCAIDAINASTLKPFAAEPFSPKTALHAIQTRTDSNAMKLGRTVHDALENNGEINTDLYVTSPFDSFRTKEAKAWKELQEENGVTVLSQADFDKACDMSRNIFQNTPQLVKDALVAEDAKREVVVEWNGYKAMIDLYANGAIYDWKTTRETDPDRIIYSSLKYGYDIQAYHYLLLAQAVNDNIKDFYFVFVSSVAPHEVYTFKCTDNFIQHGQDRWEMALERYKIYKDFSYIDCDGFSSEVLEMDYELEAEELLGEF